MTENNGVSHLLHYVLPDNKPILQVKGKVENYTELADFGAFPTGNLHRKQYSILKFFLPDMSIAQYNAHCCLYCKQILLSYIGN